MDFFAHTENSSGDCHKLAEHLNGVGELAAKFAEDMKPECIEPARWAGRLHDLGKYLDAFQEYLAGQRKGDYDTHHAVYGAALAYQYDWLAPAFAIAGHHAGLHDLDGLQAFIASEKYRASEKLDLLTERFIAELGPIAKQITEPVALLEDPLRAELYVRMLFSALVDADYLDTEKHHLCADRTPQAFQAEVLLERLLRAKDEKSQKAAKHNVDDPKAQQLNDLRNDIFNQCVARANLPCGYFSLTVPTGGGKTIAAMAFALAHAMQNRLRRVIVVIPYLSIIEQNATEYKAILDPGNEGIIVENHSAVVVPAAERELTNTTEDRARSPLELAAENWDAPVVVTTSVQFIESLFANRPSRCRKHHNIARSVVIFDEVQTLPAHLLNPLLSVLRELKESYGVSFVFSTATQPAFRRSFALTNGFALNEVKEIITDPGSVYQSLRRVRYELPQPGQTVDLADIAKQMANEDQVLCVLNTRKHAYELREALLKTLSFTQPESVFHLSSAMCAEHRLHLIGAVNDPRKGSIRLRLKHKQPCRVVSTQLVEAGVDLDFPIVFRALAPLDSIVQAAGRCNRENKLAEYGRVVVFRLAKHTLPPGIYQRATEITEPFLRTGAEEFAANPDIFADYFTELYTATQTDYTRPNENSIQQERADFNFRRVAKKARVIEDSGIPVIARYAADGRSSIVIIDEINRRDRGDRPRFDRRDLRSLQRFMVNVRTHDFNKLLAREQLAPLLPNLKLYVVNQASYKDSVGLVVDDLPMDDFMGGV